MNRITFLIVLTWSMCCLAQNGPPPHLPKGLLSGQPKYSAAGIPLDLAERLENEAKLKQLWKEHRQRMKFKELQRQRRQRGEPELQAGDLMDWDSLFKDMPVGPLPFGG